MSETQREFGVLCNELKRIIADQIKAIDGFIPGCQKPQADNYRASKA
jgi:hypothetical protein